MPCSVRLVRSSLSLRTPTLGSSARSRISGARHVTKRAPLPRLFLKFAHLHGRICASARRAGRRPLLRVTAERRHWSKRHLLRPRAPRRPAQVLVPQRLLLMRRRRL
eukprot:Amastigsp_a4899_7.p4 type:complete len:107 gc:universal Amastigsp_a4899_7:339-19(-)